MRAVRRARGRDPIQDSVCPEECRNPRLGRFQASCVSIMSNRETSDSVHPSGNKTPLGRPGLGCGALPSGQGDHTDGEGQSEGEAVDDLRWWCVVVLKRHSSVVRRPGRTCKQGRTPSPTPLFQGRCPGYEVDFGSSRRLHAAQDRQGWPTHSLTPGKTNLRVKCQTSRKSGFGGT